MIIKFPDGTITSWDAHSGEPDPRIAWEAANNQRLQEEAVAELQIEEQVTITMPAEEVDRTPPVDATDPAPKRGLFRR